MTASMTGCEVFVNKSVWDKINWYDSTTVFRIL